MLSPAFRLGQRATMLRCAAWPPARRSSTRATTLRLGVLEWIIIVLIAASIIPLFV